MQWMPEGRTAGNPVGISLSVRPDPLNLSCDLTVGCQARRLADQAALFWTAAGCGTLIESGPAAELFASPREPETRDYLQGRTG